MQRQPPDGPERLAEILSRLMVERGWGQQQQRLQLEQAWRHVVGDRDGGVSRLGALRRGVLEVLVPDASWHQVLSFERASLLKALAEQLGHQRIRALRFRLNA